MTKRGGKKKLVGPNRRWLILCAALRQIQETEEEVWRLKTLAVNVSDMLKNIKACLEEMKKRP